MARPIPSAAASAATKLALQLTALSFEELKAVFMELGKPLNLANQEESELPAYPRKIEFLQACYTDKGFSDMKHEYILMSEKSENAILRFRSTNQEGRSEGIMALNVANGITTKGHDNKLVEEFHQRLLSEFNDLYKEKTGSDLASFLQAQEGRGVEC